MAATGDRVPCVYIENQRVVNLDPKDPIQVSYTKNFPANRPEKTIRNCLPNKNQVQTTDTTSIMNGISRIGYMKAENRHFGKMKISLTASRHAVRFIEEIKTNLSSLFWDKQHSRATLSARSICREIRLRTAWGCYLEFDWSVGKIKALEKAGIRENTLIIISSDNGPGCG